MPGLHRVRDHTEPSDAAPPPQRALLAGGGGGVRRRPQTEHAGRMSKRGHHTAAAVTLRISDDMSRTDTAGKRMPDLSQDISDQGCWGGGGGGSAVDDTRRRSGTENQG